MEVVGRDWGNRHFYLFMALFQALWSGSGVGEYSENVEVAPVDVINALARMLEILSKIYA